MLGAAKVGGHVAARLRQPSVLGELIAGVLLGTVLPTFADIPGIELLAQLGALILLFEAGLESTVADMLKVGLSSLLVAVIGVATPFALGWLVGAWLAPEQGPYAHAFLGATLTATSVGITARVLADLGKSRTTEARIILGAAVIDDILGLVILAIVTGAVQSADRGEALRYGEVIVIVAKAVVFLVGALSLGLLISPRLFRLASRVQGQGVLLSTALVFCFLLSFLSSAVGLAPIVGSYAAGLILEDVHWKDFAGREEHDLRELLHPIATVLVPIFFVLMGMRVDLGALIHPEVLLLAVALTVAAVIGKQACGLGAIGRRIDRVSIGVGMIPRGEVGLIFAGIGTTLTLGGRRLLDDGMFSAIVLMIMVTTLITPPVLKWSLHRSQRGDQFADEQ
jgi:Kef-type K+ transport system membrane component KefB